MTTGLLFSDDLIRNYGSSAAGDSAYSNVMRSMQRLLESGRTWVVPMSLDSQWGGTSILENDAMESLLERGYDTVRWGGSDSTIHLLSMGRMGGPQLIGIGDFIVQHWNDLLPLYD